MINAGQYDAFQMHQHYDHAPKPIVIYPLQSIYDIVDSDITSSDKLENIIINAETNPRIYTFNKIHDYYSGLPTETFREIEGVVNFYKLIMLGKTDDHRVWFYSMVNHNVYVLTYGSKSFDTMNYQDMFSKLSGVPYEDAISNSSAVESFFDWDPALEADDFTFSSAEPVEDNDEGGNDNSGGDSASTDTGGDTSGGDALDLTAKTQETLKNDPAYGGDDNQGFDDNNGGDSASNMNGDADNMGDAPDGMDESEDDNDDEPDDEGTANKRRIRLNLVKLHTIIKDSLESMSTFTPAYNADSARRYYKIQGNLSTADDIIMRICTEQINDLTVDDLMKKYVTLCQIYDISTRALKTFAKEYQEESKLRGSQVKRDKTGERQKTW